MLRRRAAAVLVVAAVCAVLAVPPPEQTEAAWTDAEVVQGAYTALTVPAPTYVSCSGTGLLSLGESMTINWRTAANAGQLVVEYEYFDKDGLLQPVTQLLLGNGTVTTTTPNPGDPTLQRTVIQAAALGGLLGSSKSVFIRHSGPNGANDWKSAWIGVRGTWNIIGFSGCAPATHP